MAGKHVRAYGGGLRLKLLNLPVPLYAAAEAQWKGLLREYVLRGFGGHAQAYGPDEVGRSGEALDAVTTAVQRKDPDALDAPLTPRLDVDVHSKTVMAEHFALLQGVLDDAIRLSKAGELLALPPLPEVVALRNWFCDQAMAQSAGSPPARWALRGDGPEPAPAPVTWDERIEPGSETAWLIGDDHNRIVAASPAALTLLGWSEEPLVGQRLLTVIPPAYREAHLAAFVRTVVEGVGRLLGQPLQLPALKIDGTEVPIILTLTRHDASGGRAVFLGVMEPQQVDEARRPAAP